MGGGGDAPLGFVDGSFPAPQAGTPTGWVARATDADGAPVNVTAYVICAAP